MTPTLPFLPRYIRSGAVASLVRVTCIKTTWVTRITAAISMWPITRVCSIHPSYLKMYRHNTPINNPPHPIVRKSSDVHIKYVIDTTYTVP